MDDTTTPATVEIPVEEGPIATPGLQDMRLKYDKSLGAEQAEIALRVAWKLADEEIERRIGLLMKAYKDHKALSSEIRKLEGKPDVRTFGADGKPISEGFSKESIEKIKTARDKLIKLEKGMEAAIGKADYSKLS